MRERVCGALLCMGLALGGVHVAGASPADEAAAVAAADGWLRLLDAGEYDETWRKAASLFRGAVAKEQWARSVSAARRPFGTFVSRKLLGAQYAESLPGAPDGRYVVIQYEAVYENERSAVETVTPMYDQGAWRVSGYFIK